MVLKKIFPPMMLRVTPMAQMTEKTRNLLPRVELTDNEGDKEKRGLHSQEDEQKIACEAAASPSFSALILRHVESAIEVILKVTSGAVCHGLWVVRLTVIPPLVETTSVHPSHGTTALTRGNEPV